MNEILEPLLGVGTPIGLLVLLLLKIVEIMSRQSVLLAAQFLPSNAADNDRELGREYLVRVQNLESVPFDHELDVVIEGVPSGPTLDVLATGASMKVFAGPKSVVLLQDFGQCPKEPYVWKARFKEFGGFETWAFEFTIPCDRVSVRLISVGSREPRLLLPSFGYQISPCEIRTSVADSEVARIEGPGYTPSMLLVVLASVVAILTQFLFETRIAAEAGLVSSLILLLEPSAVVVGLIWVSYFLLRRPVYPVIQGYQQVTNLDRPFGAADVALLSTGSTDKDNDHH